MKRLSIHMKSVRTRTTLLLVLGMIAMSTCAQAQQGADDPLTAFIKRGMDLWRVPGAAVAVVDADTVQYQRGFGTATDPDVLSAGAAATPVDEHTLFAIASTTKAMVATGILMLIDDGLLTLDDRVVDYIPELHFRDPLLTAQTTVRDLLTHRTGLPSTDFWTFFQQMPMDEQIIRLQSVSAVAGLRARHIYQNTMYELAGLLIERVSGQTWDALLRERLWRPIGMTETFAARGRIPDTLTHVAPHFVIDDDIRLADWDLPAETADAAGSVWSSIHDMSLWVRFLLAGGVTADGTRLVSEAQLTRMFTPQSLIARRDFYPTTELTEPQWLSYGLGWFQQDFRGHKVDFHTGSLSGLIALVGIDRDRNRGVVILANRDHAEFRHALLWQVMDERAANEKPDWNGMVHDLYQRRDAEREVEWEETLSKRQANTRPGLKLDAYASRYHSPLNGTVTVARNGRELELRTARITLNMSHWHHETWLIEYKPWELREFATFHIGPDGAVSGLEAMGDHFRRVTESTGETH
ncbi:serine hydrolase [Elongatibacter sediminis]|uniref:Serine hydrolase n=1 Tax=Elongatibacter sediminis TaxID=3119006 RepID=A0AAW9R9Z0_9GAMM